MRFYRLNIPASEIGKLPNDYRMFFFASAMAFQEINLGLRLFSMGMGAFSEAKSTENYELTVMAHSNMAMLERGLISKLSEYKELLHDFLRKPAPVDEAQDMIEFRALARQSISQWNKDKTFGLMKWYRNNASAHYGFDEKGLGALTAQVGHDGDDRTFEILIHKTLANTNYIMVEQLLADKLIEHGREALEQVETNFAMIRSISFGVMDLHHQFVMAMVRRFVLELQEPVDVQIPIRLRWKAGTKTPIFLEEMAEPFPVFPDRSQK